MKEAEFKEALTPIINEAYNEGLEFGAYMITTLLEKEESLAIIQATPVASLQAIIETIRKSKRPQ